MDHSTPLGLLATHPILNNLQFADDTLLFSTSDHTALMHLFDVVRIFEKAPDLAINFSKSELLGIHTNAVDLE